MAAHELGQRRRVEGLQLQVGEEGAGGRLLLRREAGQVTRRRHLPVPLDHDAIAHQGGERRVKKLDRDPGSAAELFLGHSGPKRLALVVRGQGRGHPG